FKTYFLWTHAKDCVQQHTNFTRCGLTLTLSTNLVVWMAAVTEESIHQTAIPDWNISVSNKLYRASYGEQTCRCSHSACETFKGAFYYLYPFNIEYSLFAAAMAYVMWRNVGRVVGHRSHRKVKFQLKDMYFGPVLGFLLAIAGLVTFILYEVYIQQGGGEERNLALLIHFVMNVVIVSLLSISTVIGCVLYRLDHRERVSGENPSRSLDVGLLVGSSLGQLIISYFTTVAMVATEARGHLRALNLSWAVLLVLQLGLQNYFIVEGLNREPFHLIQMAAMHTNAQTVQDHIAIQVAIDRNGSNCVQTPGSVEPNWKRRAMKEVCAFLLLGNIILWIMPAFGARPQFDYSVMLNFYSYTVWTAIVNTGLPFAIFYRMHSSASLLEVYLSS
ncbi:proton channel OTOP2, partial [Fundulus heteroclitus]|uniref:proton channel OTOP2 n=1 Tax=Fundulus heteroclitus TaxID=8078 RepID=UPI00165C94E4